jgi:hypothetical protein
LRSARAPCNSTASSSRQLTTQTAPCNKTTPLAAPSSTSDDAASTKPDSKASWLQNKPLRQPVAGKHLEQGRYDGAYTDAHKHQRPLPGTCTHFVDCRAVDACEYVSNMHPQAEHQHNRSGQHCQTYTLRTVGRHSTDAFRCFQTCRRRRAGARVTSQQPYYAA